MHHEIVNLGPWENFSFDIYVFGESTVQVFTLNHHRFTIRDEGDNFGQLTISQSERDIIGFDFQIHIFRFRD